MPPPPPPAPPMGGPAFSKPKSAAPPVDRSALLSQIRGGAALKKTVTNDRSAPVIEGKKKNTVTDAAPKLNGPPGLGGLFAGGVPKLRPVGSSGGGSTPHTHFRPPATSGSASSPSTAPLRLPSETPPTHRAPPPFPADVTPRGPPPAPPPSSHKPSFSANTSPAESRSRAGPPLPSKPPGVTRSASQTSLNAKRPPLRAPNVKPPPPPKSPMVTAVASGGNNKFGTVGPQTRLFVPTTSVVRRQSFGAIDTRDGNDVTTAQTKTSGPPPPPRNISVPGNLNQVHKTRTAPAPPARPPTTRPPPPPRAQPPPLPSTAPPQLPQRNVQPPPPPSQAAKPVALLPSSRPSPTPPQRSSSMRNSFAPPNFESRFTFHSASTFPPPNYVPTKVKKYPSKGPRQNHQRQAPPPPVSGLSAQAAM